jgi:hypothetical protein
MDHIEGVELAFCHRVNKQAEAAQIAQQVFMEFLRVKYGFQEGDQITESGEIHRVHDQEVRTES